MQCYYKGLPHNNEQMKEEKKMNVKQVIVCRADLRNTQGQKIRTGKIVAQCCHASMKIFFDIMEKEYFTWKTSSYEFATWYKFKATPEMEKWIDGIFTKICVRVDSEAELLEVYNKAKEAGLPCALIEDCGLTEFNGVKTKTSCAIGPALSDEIDKITGGLKLL